MVVVRISHYRGLEPVFLLLLLHSPHKIFLCELICCSAPWLDVIAYGFHMYFLWLNFSVLFAKVWFQYLQQRSSSMCSCIQVRDAHKSLHFLRLNFAALIKWYFFHYYLSLFYFVHHLHLDPCFVGLGLLLLQSLQIRTLHSVCRRLRSMSVEHMFQMICF